MMFFNIDIICYMKYYDLFYYIYHYNQLCIVAYKYYVGVFKGGITIL